MTGFWFARAGLSSSQLERGGSVRQKRRQDAGATGSGTRGNLYRVGRVVPFVGFCLSEVRIGSSKGIHGGDVDAGGASPAPTVSPRLEMPGFGAYSRSGQGPLYLQLNPEARRAPTTKRGGATKRRTFVPMVEP